MAPRLETEPSNYMQTLTRYLSNIMNSTLLGLPREIRELIYFDALAHAAEMILVSCMANEPLYRRLTQTGTPTLTRCQEDQYEWCRSPRKRCRVPYRIRRQPRECRDPEGKSGRAPADRGAYADREFG